MTGAETWAADLAGGALIVATSRSVARTLLTPGSRVGLLLRWTDQATDKLFRVVAHFVDGHERRSQFRALHAPLILAIQLWTWLALYGLAFALLLWPVLHSFAAALRESGSSLLTMGFAATRGGPATTLDLAAGATGLVVIALQIAYLPTLYSAFNKREAEVTLLAVRAGSPAWGPELLARAQLMGALPELPALYATWERWAAELSESHSSYPVLMRFRSSQPLTSWLIGLLATLDAAALQASISGEVALQARLFLRMGFGCLQQLATTVGIPYNPDPRPDDGIRLTREEFDVGIARMQAYGYPVSRPVDEVWVHFQGWRVNYESIVYALAYAIDAPPALWSGPRRYPTDSIPPTRLLDRTPEDPDGTRKVPWGGSLKDTRARTPRTPHAPRPSEPAETGGPPGE